MALLVERTCSEEAIFFSIRVPAQILFIGPTFTFFNFLGLFLFFSSYIFSENSYFSYVFTIKCKNNFSNQLQKSAPFTGQLLETSKVAPRPQASNNF